MTYRDRSADTNIDLNPEEIERYLSADLIAKMLELDKRNFQERYAPHPDFPPAYHFPRIGGGRSNPRWRESDIRKWVESCKVDCTNRRRPHKIITE